MAPCCACESCRGTAPGLKYGYRIPPRSTLTQAGGRGRESCAPRRIPERRWKIGPPNLRHCSPNLRHYSPKVIRASSSFKRCRSVESRGTMLGQGPNSLSNPTRLAQAMNTTTLRACRRTGYEDASRSLRSIAWRGSAIWPDFRGQDRSGRLRCASRRSKSFIVACERPKGSSRSTPLVSRPSVVAGAGFEPATFGL
jgi:hypothetical protein